MFKLFSTLFIGSAMTQARVINIEASDDLADATWTRTPYERAHQLRVGDSLRFIANWNAHNVVLARAGGGITQAYADCNVDAMTADNGWTEARPIGNFDPVFDLDTSAMQEGVYYAVCTQRGGSHCEAGMRVQIVISNRQPGEEIQVVGLQYAQRPLVWTTNLVYPDIEAQVGDVLRWTIDSSRHEIDALDQDNADFGVVLETPEDRCDVANYGNELVPRDRDNGFIQSYDYELTASGTYSFGCFIGSHCSSGMQFNVDVVAPKKGGGKKPKTIIAAATAGGLLFAALGFVGYRRYNSAPNLEESDDTNMIDSTDTVVQFHN